MTSTEQRDKFHRVEKDVLRKWREPAGRELVREGAKIVSHLIEHGPLTVDVADAMLPADDREAGMLDYFESRDYRLETNAAGDIVGAGLSLVCDERSAVHVSEILGRRFYNWCACDIVMFPIILGVVAPCSTICPESGITISFTVTPTGLENVSHPGAWFTLAPAHGGDIRAVYCDRVNVYLDRDRAEAAVAADPDIACAPVAELWTGSNNLAALF